jgi:DNA polymerase-3 subunit gamma/tau
MLSQSAFNAFLKTLEEPPAHAVFVLATTEKHKIIPTILSRCQIFDFNRIRVEDAVEYLKQIAEKEGIGFEEDALSIIARKSDGSMRDALSIFDQVVSFSGEKITYKHVIENLHILDYEYYFRLTEMLLQGDISSSLLLFNEVLLKGFDARNFMIGYATHLRDLMVCKDPDTIQLMEVGAGIREKYLSQSASVPVSFLYNALDISNQADIQFRTSRNQRLTIELALVKLSGLAQHQKKKEIISEPDSGSALSEAESAEQPEVQKPPSGTVSEGANVVSRKSSISIKETLRGPTGKTRIPEDSPGGAPDKEGPGSPGTELPEPDLILNAWKSFAKSAEKSRPRIHSTLVNNKPVIKADGTIQVMLNSEAQRENFIKNIWPELIGYIRKHTGLKNVEIETGLTEAETNGKRIYTEQDKLDYLMKKNPDLGKLKTRFSLDFDD